MRWYRSILAAALFFTLCAIPLVGLSQWGMLLPKPAASGGTCCSIVGSALHTEGTGSSVTTLTTAGNFNVSTGNLLVVGCRYNNSAGSPSVTDTGSTNTFTLGILDGTNDVAWFYANSAVAKTGDQFSCNNVAPAFSFGAVTAIQFSGQTTGCVDTTTTGTATGASSVTSSAFTTTHAREILLAYADQAGGFASSFTAGSGYTLAPGSGQTIAAAEYQLVTTIQTSVTASMSWSGVTGNSKMVVMTCF